MDEEIKKVLKGFFSEMHDWELFCAKTDDEIENDDSIDEDAADEEKERRVNEIFARYCTPKERKQGRLGMYQRPPAYDESEEILEIEYPNPKKAVATTEAKTGMRDKNRYTLFYKNDRWLIDYKERFSPYEGKWVKGVL